MISHCLVQAGNEIVGEHESSHSLVAHRLASPHEQEQVTLDLL